MHYATLRCSLMAYWVTSIAEYNDRLLLANMPTARSHYGLNAHPNGLLCYMARSSSDRLDGDGERRRRTQIGVARLAGAGLLLNDSWWV